MLSTRPTDIPGLRRILGMVNYLAKFVPNLAATLQPLHNLLKKRCALQLVSEC